MNSAWEVAFLTHMCERGVVPSDQLYSMMSFAGRFTGIPCRYAPWVKRVANGANPPSSFVPSFQKNIFFFFSCSRNMPSGVSCAWGGLWSPVVAGFMLKMSHCARPVFFKVAMFWSPLSTTMTWLNRVLLFRNLTYLSGMNQCSFLSISLISQKVPLFPKYSATLPSRAYMRGCIVSSGR